MILNDEKYLNELEKKFSDFYSKCDCNPGFFCQILLEVIFKCANQVKLF